MEPDELSSEWVRKGQLGGVQGVPRKSQALAIAVGHSAFGTSDEDGLVGSVNLVPDQWKARRPQVSADLVLTARSR